MMIDPTTIHEKKCNRAKTDRVRNESPGSLIAVFFRAIGRIVRDIPLIPLSGFGAYAGIFPVTIFPTVSLITYITFITYLGVLRLRKEKRYSRSTTFKLLGLSYVLLTVALTTLVSRAKEIVRTLPRLESSSVFLLINLLSSQTIPKRGRFAYFARSFLLGSQAVCLWSLGMMTERCCGMSVMHIFGDGECSAIDNSFLCRVVPNVVKCLLISSFLLHYWRELRYNEESDLEREGFYHDLVWRLACHSGRRIIVYAGWLSGIFIVPVLFYVIITMGMGYLMMAARLDALLIGGTCFGVGVDYFLGVKLSQPVLIILLLVALMTYAFPVGVAIGALWCNAERRELERGSKGRE